jgi:hypothetical protein
LESRARKKFSVFSGSRLFKTGRLTPIAQVPTNNHATDKTGIPPMRVFESSPQKVRSAAGVLCKPAVLGLSLLAVLAGVTANAQEGDGCHQCGCRQRARKVCRVVCGVKKVKQVRWGCRYDDVCLPGPCRKSCCDDGCGSHEVLMPTCGKVRSRKRLIRYIGQIEVPIYKYVIEEVCSECGEIDGLPVQPPREKSVAPAPPVPSDSAAIRRPRQFNRGKTLAQYQSN